MNTARESSPNPPRTLPEAVVRTLRHEVGDLLQTVYAAAAVLQQRLPQGWDLEQRILADMRARGDACKGLIDITHDLICPVTLNLESVNLAELLVHATAAAAARRPDVKLETELVDAPAVQADAHKLTQVARSLLTDACQADATRVRVTLAPVAGGREVRWTVQRNGANAPAAEMEHYFSLSKTGYQGPLSLTMLHARKMIELHGGSVFASEPPEGGLLVTVLLPLDRAADA
jgi:signal transduction histidine kinase